MEGEVHEIPAETTLMDRLTRRRPARRGRAQRPGAAQVGQSLTSTPACASASVRRRRSLAASRSPSLDVVGSP
jgi:hypothetical protein